MKRSRLGRLERRRSQMRSRTCRSYILGGTEARRAGTGNAGSAARRQKKCPIECRVQPALIVIEKNASWRRVASLEPEGI